jgi:hypothetical protein
VADFRSERPTSNRNQRPTSFRNRWPTCSGIRTLNRIRGRFGASLACVAFEHRGDPAEGTESLNVTHEALDLNAVMVPPEEYAERVNRRRAPPNEQDPPRKEVKKSVNDVLAWWSQQFLSPQMAVNDVDVLHGLREGGTPLLLELKRSNVKGWLPYLEDVANFVLLRSLADQGGCGTVIVRYHDDEVGVADLFSFPTVSRAEIKGTTVRVVRADPDDAAAEILRVARTVRPEGTMEGGRPYTRTG